MNKIQLIQQRVNEHFAAKARRDIAYAEMERLGRLTMEGRIADDSYNSSQDAAMTLLRDVLPLLTAAVEWNSAPGMKLYRDTLKIEAEVQKLLMEVE